MACRASSLTNAELISNLFNSRLIKSTRVRDAMSSVDRAHYASYSPYEDSPQGIGFGATISAPHQQQRRRPITHWLTTSRRHDYWR